MVDPALLELLNKEGMGDFRLEVEKRLGINLGAVESELSKFITRNKACEKLKMDVRRLCVHDYPVLIHGETGTGKETIAKALGANRKAGRFVAVNVAAIPEALVESTLFGYKKGSFTGASQDTPGLIQHAAEGTLFLDEIGDLPLLVQAKFLRVMQDKRVRRVGSNEEEEVKCRFIAASHHDIRKLVDEGKFRLDLYARLSTFVLNIPPLRERLEDISHIMVKLNSKFPVAKVDWTKVDLSLNVRSLEQYAARYAVLEELPK